MWRAKQCAIGRPSPSGQCPRACPDPLPVKDGEREMHAPALRLRLSLDDQGLVDVGWPPATDRLGHTLRANLKLRLYPLSCCFAGLLRS